MITLEDLKKDINTINTKIDKLYSLIKNSKKNNIKNKLKKCSNVNNPITTINTEPVCISENSSQEEEEEEEKIYKIDTITYPSIQDTIKEKNIIKKNITPPLITIKQPEKIRKYIQTIVIPKQAYNIKKCKYGENCWNVICVCYHNDIQEEYYNNFFITNPCPSNFRKEELELCKYGNKCNNKKNCKFVHSEIDLLTLKKNINNWIELKNKHWFLSIKNDIGKRYINEIDKYDIILKN